MGAKENEDWLLTYARALGPIEKTAICAGTLDTPGGRAGSAAWQGSASAAAKHRHVLLGFRQPEWQALHLASLQLLSRALAAACAVPAKDGSISISAETQAELSSANTSRSAVMEAMITAVPDQDALAAVRNACLLVNPSCSNHDYSAAIAGLALPMLGSYSTLCCCGFMRIKRFLLAAASTVWYGAWRGAPNLLTQSCCAGQAPRRIEWAPCWCGWVCAWGGTCRGPGMSL